HDLLLVAPREGEGRQGAVAGPDVVLGGLAAEALRDRGTAETERAVVRGLVVVAEDGALPRGEGDHEAHAMAVLGHVRAAEAAAAGSGGGAGAGGGGGRRRGPAPRGGGAPPSRGGCPRGPRGAPTGRCPRRPPRRRSRRGGRRSSRPSRAPPRARRRR